MICEWCETNSGRTHANRECCKLRLLAQAPRHVQKAYGDALTSEQRDELRPRLKAESERLKGLK